MSNTLAVATVTEALRQQIAQSLAPDIPFAVDVAARKPPTDPPAEPTITVFLYQVTPNPSLRNMDAPTRAADGTVLTRPSAALDLHYLISFYGDEAELVPQRLLGCVVRTLHENPVLSKAMIEAAAEQPYLQGTDLADSPQRVRFTPTALDIDDTSKLWGMLYQNNTPYALSLIYQGIAVMIDGRATPVEPKPVKTRTVHAVPEAG
ncbi:DUF4255 domain-containing protein [Streptomyces roseochromogenus]|uniref:Pvc16 N-terminal domain-containing protein n=1 Tax=Streptomyces roseochromogenus subsp. oscitans DS 12.976 TaxID=1352936 RepID=V6JLF6_STRRC|nr:DUF4255 domain-containing protein [Streptomyces roseochromogenus]EST20568.1 hypothetical protein M878_39375 [Streptomyces roseochromogenus subsp. oscitans DS 12.976]